MHPAYERGPESGSLSYCGSGFFRRCGLRPAVTTESGRLWWAAREENRPAQPLAAAGPDATMSTSLWLPPKRT